jgi:hypothetical protein
MDDAENGHATTVNLYRHYEPVAGDDTTAELSAESGAGNHNSSSSAISVPFVLPLIMHPNFPLP